MPVQFRTPLPSDFNLKIGKIVFPLLILFFVYLFLKSIFVFVPPGYVGAIYDRGRGVLPGELREGINVLIPLWQTPQLFDARLQEYTMATLQDKGPNFNDDSLDAPTSDGQQVRLDVTVLFKIEPGKAPVVWKTIGTNYIDKIVRSITRSQARMVVSRYSAPEIYSEKRQEAEGVMQKEIGLLLKDKNILLDRLLLRAVYFSPEYSQAIENKVIAEQRIKQAEFEVKEASQRAQAKIQEAKGLAEAQTLQKQSLTQEFLQLEAIKKWNGIMPQVAGSSSLPFINIPLAR